MQYTRDRFTWLAYLMLAYFAYIMAALGPLMPFLRAELNLNYVVAGLHVTAFALGTTGAGLFGDRIAERFGRRRVFWGGGAGMVIGSVLFVGVPHELVTISASFLMGLLGSFVMVMVQASLADKYGALRSIAFTESNVAASLATVFVPLVIGFGEGTGFGWRVSLWLTVGAWVALLLVFRNERFPQPAPRPVDQRKQPLPMRFWLYWLVIFFSVSVEWCLGFWGADFLENRAGLGRVTASTLMSVFFAAMVVGRLIGSRLTRRMESSGLLIAASAIVVIGFPLFWLAQVPLLNVIGLFISGIGIANLYPLTLSVATSIDPARSNTASARASLGAGAAILITPQILGAIADQIGIYGAFGIAAVLSLVVTALAVLARRVPVTTAARA